MQQRKEDRGSVLKMAEYRALEWRGWLGESAWLLDGASRCKCVPIVPIKLRGFIPFLYRVMPKIGSLVAKINKHLRDVKRWCTLVDALVRWTSTKLFDKVQA